MVQNLSISHCIATLNPSRWNPMSKPPIPVKKDANVGGISYLIE